MNFHSLPEIVAGVQAGTFTVRQLVQYHLDVISQSNDRLNIFLTVYADEALEAADRVDQKLATGTAGKLAGLVVGIKDVFCYQNHPLQCGSKILDDFESQFSSTVVQRLIDADAIIIGRQNCDEFAMGSTNENSAFGPSRNPVDDSRVPGGSSGGSAAAVAANMCQVSIGSDTGGSVRQPAAFCGVVGLKPNYGRISRHGLAAYASSFDTVGILSKSIEDSAAVLEVVAGHDDFDSTASTEPVAAYTEAIGSKRKFKVGYIKETLEHEVLQPDIREASLNFVGQLKKSGHQVEEIHFSMLDYVLPTYYVLTTAEASSNLSRYDGVRYGYRADAQELEAMYKQSRSQGFGKEVKRRIMAGTFVLSASYYDAYYTQAQKVRKMIQEETDRLFADYDFILSPTTPTTALKIGDVADDPLQMYLEDLFTVQANVAGVPAVSLPIGTDAEGLPIGIQLISKSFCESDLLDISQQILSLEN